MSCEQMNEPHDCASLFPWVTRLEHGMVDSDKTQETPYVEQVKTEFTRESTEE